VIREGSEAPDFELAADDGERVRLSSLRGKPVVIFFYPKDDTPGCTTQACGLRDVYGELQRRGAVVLGVSRDDGASHRRFKEKYGLPFTLLSDPEAEVADQYGVWVERNQYGKKSMGINRSTFVLDADGNVARALYGVKSDAHADLVLDALQA
jgi:thioredoxin-dependent peroxiredoxin